MTDIELNNLISSDSNQRSLCVDNCDKKILISYLRSMILIRLAEQKLAFGREHGSIGGPVHLGVGQEAIAVGVSSALRDTDRVFGAHRSHGHALALGSSVRKLFAEVLGKDTGLSRGMGGSMHLWDQSKGFYGSVPIVSGTIPLAVGAAMAARLSKVDDVAVAYFGDGACEEGVVHESLNLASLNKEPVIFVVENNMFASHMHWSQRQHSVFTHRFAEANGIPCKVVDGNNVIEVAKIASEMVEVARNGGGPGFIEAITYRWYGHVDWREDIDVGVCREQSDVENWRAKDPVERLVSGMILAEMITEDEYSLLRDELSNYVDTAWKLALQDPYPSLNATLSRVYK